jgi:hypothetical protein
VSSPPYVAVQAAPPPPTITLGVALDEAAVTVTLDVPLGATRVWLWRVSPSGASEYVRGVVDLAVAGAPTQLLLFDFEAPFDVELVYHAQSANDADEMSVEATTQTITLPLTACEDTWLTDVAQPSNSQEIVVEGLQELAYAVPASVHKVIARRGPIVLSDVAAYPSFELGFLTSTEAERENARGSLGNGVPLLLKTPPANGIGNLYFSVLGWREQRIVKPARVPDRHFLVSCQQVDRPDPKLIVPTTAIASYLDVRSDFADYEQVRAQRNSYSALLVTYTAGGEGGAIVPWPPTDA